MKTFTKIFLCAVLSVHASVYAKGIADEIQLLPNNNAPSASPVSKSKKPNDELDKKIEVAYVCKMGNESVPLTVMYGLKNDEIVVAQAKFLNNISPGLFPVADKFVQRFSGVAETGIQTTWTTLPAQGEAISQVDGGILSFLPPNHSAQTIIVEKCKLDKNRTLQLNRQ